MTRKKAPSRTLRSLQADASCIIGVTAQASGCGWGTLVRERQPNGPGNASKRPGFVKFCEIRSVTPKRISQGTNETSRKSRWLWDFWLVN